MDKPPIAAHETKAGRPATMQGGKRVNVYLDAASLARAAALGKGNVSEGLRAALSAAEPAQAVSAGTCGNCKRPVVPSALDLSATTQAGCSTCGSNNIVYRRVRK